MGTARRDWKICDKNRFLFAVMNELAGNAQISFEGDLRSTRLLDLPGATTMESALLKRNTLAPKQDFVIAPLECSTVQAIIAAIGGTIPRSVLHIQIAKAGKLEFGAYDRFHPECLFLGSAINQTFLDSLTAKGILAQSIPNK